MQRDLGNRALEQVARRMDEHGVRGIRVRRFTVDEYHQMIRAGILTEDEPVELLEAVTA